MIKLIGVRGNPKYSAEPGTLFRNRTMLYRTVSGIPKKSDHGRLVESPTMLAASSKMFHYADDANELRF